MICFLAVQLEIPMSSYNDDELELISATSNDEDDSDDDFTDSEDDVTALDGSDSGDDSSSVDEDGTDSEDDSSDSEDDSAETEDDVAAIDDSNSGDDTNTSGDDSAYETSDDSASSEDDSTLDGDTSLDDEGTTVESYDKYQFVVVANAVAQAYELDDGNLELKSVDDNETYSVIDSTIIKTEVETYGTELTEYADLDGDGFYSVVSHTWTANADFSGSDAVLEYEDWYEHNGLFEDYEVAILGQSAELKDASTGELVASFEAADRLIFEDKVIANASDVNASMAFRLYEAVFNRNPMEGDTAGLGYWVGEIDAGMTLEDVAARFIDSSEFVAAYGASPDNATFLTKLYENILDRSPDSEGYGWWLNELNTNAERTQAKVLAEFAESDENQMAVADLVATGIVYDVVI